MGFACHKCKFIMVKFKTEFNLTVDIPVLSMTHLHLYQMCKALQGFCSSSCWKYKLSLKTNNKYSEIMINDIIVWGNNINVCLKNISWQQGRETND